MVHSAFKIYMCAYIHTNGHVVLCVFKNNIKNGTIVCKPFCMLLVYFFALFIEVSLC